MDNYRRWLNYDWFKLIVALVLLVILVVLLLQPPAPAVAENGPGLAATATGAPAIPTSTSAPPTPTAPQVAEATQPAPTQPPTTVPQPTQAPTEAPTTAPATPAPAAASPTATPEAAQPTTAPATVSGDCSKALPARVGAGQKAKVLDALNLRYEAGMDKPIQLTNPPGTILDIIGGPVCIPFGEGVYRWWNVRMANGTTGWSVEAPLTGTAYFMQPAP